MKCTWSPGLLSHHKWYAQIITFFSHISTKNSQKHDCFLAPSQPGIIPHVIRMHAIRGLVFISRGFTNHITENAELWFSFKMLPPPYTCAGVSSEFDATQDSRRAIQYICCWCGYPNMYKKVVWKKTGEEADMKWPKFCRQLFQMIVLDECCWIWIRICINFIPKGSAGKGLYNGLVNW